VDNPFFYTEGGIRVPSVNEAQMREVDRIAVEEYGLEILQMMENAGRNLALAAMKDLPKSTSSIVILAGTGGNGGGGICCARHLRNRGYNINLILSKEENELRGSAKSQFQVIKKSGFQLSPLSSAEELINNADLVVDALIGYSLNGAPRGTIADLIRLTNLYTKDTLSLDIPSGIDSSTGETPGVFVKANQTLTLALPKPGLENLAAGDIFLADIGIPPEVYQPLGIFFEPFFSNQYRISLTRSK